MKNIKTLSIGVLAFFTVVIVSCKVEDPFLDSTVAPVLVDVQGATFGAPISATANVPTDSSSKEITVASRLLELDKTNILDNTKGIDSIPVAGIKVTLTYELTKTVKVDTLLFKGITYTFKDEVYKKSDTWGEITTDTNGQVSIKTSYKELGFEENLIQRKGDIIKITWKGTHKGIPFTRFSQITVTDK
ncbi:hypothetical protein [Dyadobacter sp. CY312]|uniref:hypothetical protein n=1 Tax=Dyadobacter sp. CY312 TaxID=2907303 RepID=UPI001F287ECD|nr:hypothetical protein [Dyadobacter sp. CY312]MCE7040741.1 hypothetical protein [Dyadobacter sp. CY312]